MARPQPPRVALGYVPGMPDDIQSLLATLPIDELAAQTGESPDAVREAAGVALPALLGGLQANADSGDASSLLEALGQHEDRDPSAVDASEGAQIASHIFGSHEEQVISQLGSTGLSSDLLQKLIPLLAPFVMAWLAKQMSGEDAAGGKDLLESILGRVLGTGSTGGSQAGSASAGSILGNLLDGLLGGAHS